MDNIAYLQEMSLFYDTADTQALFANIDGVRIFGEIVNLSSESLKLANVSCAVKQQENLFVNICNIPSPIAQCCVAAADSNARA